MCELTSPRHQDLPLDDHAASEARRFLRTEACPYHATPVIDDAELLVSELVTNGVRYGAPPISVVLVCKGAVGLRVLVSDGVSSPPRPREARPDEESGRGLALVDYISEDWGVQPHGNGKTVWFSVAFDADAQTKHKSDVPAPVPQSVPE